MGSLYTYKTIAKDAAAADAALCAYASLFGDVERRLFVEIKKGGDLTKLKPELCREHGLTSRQFNAVRFQLEGKIDAVKAQRKGLIEQMKGRIKKAGQVLKKLLKPPKRGGLPETPAEKQTRLQKHHEKKRRSVALEGRLERLEADHKAGVVSIAFGGLKRFCAQFNLAANGYEDHTQWQAGWRAARCSQFFVLGSGDETAGCQGCVATVNDDDESLDLRVRLPDAVLQDPSIQSTQ